MKKKFEPVPAGSFPAGIFDAIVIGAGASGLMCAATAARRGRNVMVLEKSGSTCRKVRLSGGGRCNFTNRLVGHDNFVSSNPNFPRSALSRFTPADFIAMVEQNKIPYHDEGQGQLFCNGSSLEIVRMLETNCAEAGAKTLLNCEILETERTPDSSVGNFSISTSQGRFSCHSLVIATGGLSYPQAGATRFGFNIAKKFGIEILPCRPALVPLVWAPSEKGLFDGLSGVTGNARVSTGKISFEGNFVFTHRGMSGPVILQISNYWAPGGTITVDTMPGRELLPGLIEARKRGASLTTALSAHLPKSLARALSERFIGSRLLKELSDRELAELSDGLHGWTFVPGGTDGYDRAEVTAGGVDTREISPKTMETKKVPGLFFIGEVLDVTGQLGGFNLQWAWSSGFAAGEAV